MRIQEEKIGLQKKVHRRFCVSDITFLTASSSSYVNFYCIFRLLPPFRLLQFYIENNFFAHCLQPCTCKTSKTPLTNCICREKFSYFSLPYICLYSFTRSYSKIYDGIVLSNTVCYGAVLYKKRINCIICYHNKDLSIKLCS